MEEQLGTLSTDEQESQLVPETQVPVVDEKTTAHEKKLDDELMKLENPVAPREWELTHPDVKEPMVFIQKELTYFNKLRFLRLTSQTIRLAAQSEDGKGVEDMIFEILDVNDMSALTGDAGAEQIAGRFAGSIMRLVEYVPDYIEQLYMLILQPRPNEREFLQGALETLTDEEGFEMLELFVEQNGAAIRKFFTRSLRDVGKKLQGVLSSGE